MRIYGILHDTYDILLKTCMHIITCSACMSYVICHMSMLNVIQTDKNAISTHELSSNLC